MSLRKTLILFTAVLYGIACRNTAPPPPLFRTIDSTSVIYEGQGVDSIHLTTTTRDSLKKYFAQRYDSIKYANYSVEIVYPGFGVGFYYSVNDISASIFSMSFDSSFKGRTSRGFDIQKMTMADVMRIYGQPDWQMPDDMLYAHFDSIGIYFTVRPSTIPEPDFYEGLEHYDEGDREPIVKSRENHYYDSAYRTARIIEISIGKPGTNF